MRKARTLIDMNPKDLAWFLEHFGIDHAGTVKFSADVSRGRAVFTTYLYDSEGRGMVDSKGNTMTREFWISFNHGTPQKFPDPYYPLDAEGNAAKAKG